MARPRGGGNKQQQGRNVGQDAGSTSVAGDATNSNPGRATTSRTQATQLPQQGTSSNGEKNASLNTASAAQEDEIVIVWLRDDMRFVDNHALAYGEPPDAHLKSDAGGVGSQQRFYGSKAPSSSGTGNTNSTANKQKNTKQQQNSTSVTRRILPVFIHNPADCSPWPLRGAGLWYKGKSLRTFAEELQTKYGLKLIIRSGDPLDVMLSLIAETGATRVVFNERYEPWYVSEDDWVRAELMKIIPGDNLSEKCSSEFWEEYKYSCGGASASGTAGGTRNQHATAATTNNPNTPTPTATTASSTPAPAFPDDLDPQTQQELIDAGILYLPGEENASAENQLLATDDSNTSSSTPPFDLVFVSKIQVDVTPGSLLVAPWVADPEVNAEGWGFGSVQWYKKAVCNIPQEHLVVKYLNSDSTADHNGVRQNYTTKQQNGTGRTASAQTTAVDLEEYLKPLPRIKQLIGLKNQNAIFSFTLDDLGYDVYTCGKNMPVSKKKSEKMMEDEKLNYLPKNAPGWMKHHPQWNSGRFKQYNPRYLETNLKPMAVVAAATSNSKEKDVAEPSPPVLNKPKPKYDNPAKQDWAYEMKKFWTVGEQAGLNRLEIFCNEILAEGLFEGRERFRADREYTAMLSPYVRFGELTARTCFARGALVLGEINLPEKGWRQLRATFLRRFLWRDLAYWCLWRFPDLPDTSLRRQYEHQKWWTMKDEEETGTATGNIKTSGTSTSKAATSSSGFATNKDEDAPAEAKTRSRFRKKKDDSANALLSVKKEAAAIQQQQLTGSFAPAGRTGPNNIAGQGNNNSMVGAAGAAPGGITGNKSQQNKTGPSEQEKELLKEQSYANQTSNKINESLKSRFTNNSSLETKDRLRRWQRGKTGFPLVDAAMVQLWKIGWMPNYLRHVVAQFLIEYLDVNWKHGFEWFDYTLIDTDVSINAHMWQNGGHSGLDQWNFVMHPVFAAKSCDPEGNYVKRWLPELASFPIEYIHCPWEAPAKFDIMVLQVHNYPMRILQDLDKARKKHAENVLEVRKKFRKELVSGRGNEFLWLDCDYVGDFTPEWEVEKREKGLEWLEKIEMMELQMQEQGIGVNVRNGTRAETTTNNAATRGGAGPVRQDDPDTMNLITAQQFQQIQVQNGLAENNYNSSANSTAKGNGKSATWLPKNLNERRAKAYEKSFLPKEVLQQKSNKKKHQQALAEERQSRKPNKRGMLRRVELITRVDFREDSLDFLTVQTADKPRHFKKRELKNTWEQQIMTEVMGEWRRGGGEEKEDAL
ncbi:unnamed protein product [Amoebophrya sp. A120]|nr:unnamed protein product [Amoebophrya sp. A120]|eukprot:GSA120T00019335001.1